MKRLIYTLLAVTLCISLFVSCEIKETDIYSFLTDMCGVFDESANIGKGVIYDTKQLPPERFGRLYTGKNEPPPCFSRIADYAIRLPTDESGFEIHIIKCVNRSDTSEVANMLNLRIEMLSDAEIRQYAPDTYMRYFRNAEIYVKDKCVFLLATPNNQKCIKMIKDRSFR